MCLLFCLEAKDFIVSNNMRQSISVWSMEYREFGRSKVKVSAVGMGTYYGFLSIVSSKIFGYQRSREDKVSALKKGLELGINLIDTAEIYCTEPLVGEAIRDFSRDDLFIATKVLPYHLRYDQVLKAAERSLRRLKTSYIDLYQIHFPNSRVPIKETMSAMEKLVEKGMVRYIGLSNFSLEQTKEAEQALSRYELASCQIEYSLKKRDAESDLLSYCFQNDIAVLSYRPLARGLLADPPGHLKETICRISGKYGGKTPAQIALNWLLAKNKLIFPIPRASKPERVIEDVGATGWSLSPEDTSDLEKSVR